MNRSYDWRQYIVHDFYREISENEDVINYTHFRALLVVDQDEIVVCTAILEKPKNRIMWKYSLSWSYNGTVMTKYVTPFRATKNNRIRFNKISRHTAKKLTENLEKAQQTTQINYPGT